MNHSPFFGGSGPKPVTDRLYVPLQFWFNRNPGLALPLIALQYHEVKILMKFRAANKIGQQNKSAVPGIVISGYEYLTSSVPATSPSALKASLWVDYIYLDTEERRRFAQMSHEYLIDQLQFTGSETVTNSTSGSTSVRMNFNHPVKELVWVFQDSDVTDVNDLLSYNLRLDHGAVNEPGGKMKVMLNGHDRASERDASYYRLMQPWTHHTNTPQKPIYVYSFALRPEEHQPSGTCNFSRIDNATLKVALNEISAAGSVSIKVFAVNYNVLRVVSGMGGLAYSN